MKFTVRIDTTAANGLYYFYKASHHLVFVNSPVTIVKVIDVTSTSNFTSCRPPLIIYKWEEMTNRRKASALYDSSFIVYVDYVICRPASKGVNFFHRPG